MEPDNVTTIPVNDAPDEQPSDVPVETPEAATPEPEPGIPVGEHLSSAQPPEPNPVPATSGVETDAVSVNRYLEDVEQKINEAKEYVKTFLAAHELSKEVLAELEVLAEKVKNGKI